jgi:hypothetical protein
MSRNLAAGAAAALMVIASPSTGRSNPDRDEAVEQTHVAVQRVALAPTELRDEAAMVLVGAGLLVLAAAVRRAA